MTAAKPAIVSGNVNRRSLLGTGIAMAGEALLGSDATAGQADHKAAPRLLSIVDTALSSDTPIRPADFGTVGVFDVDWLTEPRFVRLLDNFAASPAAFRGVRFFGALNSGER